MLQAKKKVLFQVPSSNGSSLKEALLGSHFGAGHDQHVVIWEWGHLHQASPAASESFSLWYLDIVRFQAIGKG